MKFSETSILGVQVIELEPIEDERGSFARAFANEEMRAAGLPSLHRRLSAVDPVAAGRIHPNDPQRTLRALEVWETAGRPLSELQSAKRVGPTLSKVCFLHLSLCTGPIIVVSLTSTPSLLDQR